MLPLALVAFGVIAFALVEWTGPSSDEGEDGVKTHPDPWGVAPEPPPSMDESAVEAVTDLDRDGNRVFHYDVAIGLVRKLRSNLFLEKEDRFVEAYPEPSGKAVPPDETALAWALHYSATEPILMPIYAAYDKPLPRFLRAGNAGTFARDGGMYAILAYPGQLATLVADTEASDGMTPAAPPPPPATAATPPAVTLPTEAVPLPATSFPSEFTRAPGTRLPSAADERSSDRYL